MNQFSPTPLLRLRNLSTGYASRREGKVVSSSLCAELQSGSLTALIGVNGTGKSTLLRTLAALQPPLVGSVEWCGREVRTMSVREVARTVAVVLTERTDAGGLTVEEVVRLGRLPHGTFVSRMADEDRAVVERVMQTVGVSQWRARRLSSLSDGERQRVMIARALAQQTPAILLDEPTAFLDFPAKVALMQLLQRLAHEEEKTVLFSTHDLELAFQTADGLWILSPDGLVCGTPEQLAADGTIGRLFAADATEFDARLLRFNLSFGKGREI